MGWTDLTASDAKGSPFPEVTIHSIGMGGDGVGTLPDGRTAFVPRTAPGDRIVARLTQVRPRWVRAEAVSWLEEGLERQLPPCPLYADCGGCALQHLTYPEQLRWKGRMVADALARIGGFPIESVEVEPSPDLLRYRNRLTFTLRRLGGGRVVAGFRQRGRPGRVLDVSSQCLLPQPSLLEGWVGLRSGWGPAAVNLPSGRELRLTLRCGEEGAWLLIRGGQGDGDGQALVEASSGLVSVFRWERDGTVRHLAGAEDFRVHWLGEGLDLSGGGFLQVNPAGGQALHRYVLAQSGNPAGLRVIDGYCGFGALGRALARAGATVVGMEADPAATAVAEELETPGYRIVRGRVEEELASHLPADLVLLNPPRAGLHPGIPLLLRDRRVGRVIYVSCDPATLARDLRRFGKAYQIREVRAFDLFPQTARIEAVVTFEATRG